MVNKAFAYVTDLPLSLWKSNTTKDYENVTWQDEDEDEESLQSDVGRSSGKHWAAQNCIQKMTKWLKTVQLTQKGLGGSDGGFSDRNSGRSGGGGRINSGGGSDGGYRRLGGREGWFWVIFGSVETKEE